MIRQPIPRTEPPSVAWLCFALAVTPGVPGCTNLGLNDGSAVTVATAWPASERARVEKAFQGRIRWVLLAPEDDLARVARHQRPPDVLLGGPARIYQALDRAKSLEPDLSGQNPGQEGPAWRVARRASLGSAVGPKTEAGSSPSDASGGLTFDDPRRDPVSLAWAQAQLASGPWAAGYAKLVRAAGGRRSPGRTPGAAFAAVERGEATSAPMVTPWDDRDSPRWPAVFVAEGDGQGWIEGVAVLRNARHPEQARTFLLALERIGLADVPGSSEPGPTATSIALLADLLDAALVEARDELQVACDALDRAGNPERSARWMTVPPPWPPASVAKILERESNAMPMLETLAGQVAPEADARAWLVRSWLANRRSVDGAFLEELAGAAGGRLAEEPRFRAWLRGEWTAWARQRYRRVARQAEGALP